MVVVGKCVGLGQGEMIREILSLEVTPGLWSVDDSPLVWYTPVFQSFLKNLLGRDPVVCSGTETLRLIEPLLSTLRVQVERKKPFSFICYTGKRSSWLVRCFK